jgi:hypothetical protein
MSVTTKRQIQIVLEGIPGTLGREVSRKEASSKGRRDLDVAERRSVEVGIGRLQDCTNLARATRPQQIFDNC